MIAARAADGSDEHYAQLASVASVSQLRTAIALEPRPEPRPDPQPSISRGADDQFAWWRIKLPHAQAATVEAAIAAHREALIAEWKATSGQPSDGAPPMPGDLEAFLSLVEAGWDTDATRRPHGQHTTVIVHLDLQARAAALHLGPLLTDAERQYLTCDATCEVWFERAGRPIGVGRATRTVNRRLRRALEHRDQSCAVPGCGTTRGLHAHHIVHWEHGGPTELTNLVLLCPFHHRAHHSGLITITGPADTLVVTDSDGEVLTGHTLARPPNHPPPDVPPYPGPTGERAHWWWYQPYEPHPPPCAN